MNGVFVSYRRSDSAGWTGRLVAELGKRLAKTRIFIDIDAVSAGQDFHNAIESALSSSGVVLVVIGPRWLEAVMDGRPRLFEPSDLVALEVARALSLPEAHVIPVLVGDAQLPETHQLPESLAALARRQAIELSDSRWNHDIDRLVQSLSAIGLPQREAAGWRAYRVPAGVVLLLAAAALTWNLQRDRARPDLHDGRGVASEAKVASATTTSTEGSTSRPPPGTTSAAPSDEGSPAAISRAASRPDDPASSAPANLRLNGLWAGDFARFSDNSRRREVIRLKVEGAAVYGESWQETWQDGASEPRLYRKFSFGNGKLEGRSISFCVPVAFTVGNNVEKYRNCDVGSVRGDAIAFRVTYQVDHPTEVPEQAQFVARRLN